MIQKMTPTYESSPLPTLPLRVLSAAFCKKVENNIQISVFRFIPSLSSKFIIKNCIIRLAARHNFHKVYFT